MFHTANIVTRYRLDIDGLMTALLMLIFTISAYISCSFPLLRYMGAENGFDLISPVYERIKLPNIM